MNSYELLENEACEEGVDVVGYDFRTVEEFLQLNDINEHNCNEHLLQNVLKEYYTKTWQWIGIN